MKGSISMKSIGERFLNCIVDAYKNDISKEAILNNHQKLTAISNILDLGYVINLISKTLKIK